MSAGMKGLEERLRAYSVSDPDESRPGELRVGPMMLRQICDEAADRIATLEAEVDGLLAVVADRDRRLKLWEPTTVCQTVSSSYREAVRAFNTTKESDIDRAALAAGEGIKS